MASIFPFTMFCSFRPFSERNRKKPPSGRSSPFGWDRVVCSAASGGSYGAPSPGYCSALVGSGSIRAMGSVFYSPAVVSAFCLPAGRPPAFMFGPFEPELMIAQRFDAVN
nr:MAG TPA: hypothetical protein [Caudoviricetes sp.]